MTFFCEICNKNYKSYKTLWNHNNTFHKLEIANIKNKDKDFICQKCSKKFRTKQNLQNHITNACKKKNEELEITLLKDEIKVLKEKVNQISENKITNNTNSNNSTNNGTINNNVQIIINKIGTENINDLNEKEVKEIFSNNLESLIKFIQHMNFNSRLPSNHNFCTTSLDGQYLTIYNTEKSEQQKERKKYFFEDLLSRSIGRMEQLYNKYKTKFKKDKQIKIEEDILTLKMIRDRDMNDTLLREMLKKLNLLSYNYKETVLKTWNNPDTSGIKEKTFEEDLNDDDSDIKDIEDIFIKDDDSDEEVPKLEIKKKKTYIEV